MKISAGAPIRLLLLLCGGVISLAQAEPAATSANPANTVVTVNGQPITSDQLNLVIAGKQATGQPLNTDALLDELITIEVLKQAAIKDGLEQRKDIQGLLQQQRTNLLAQSYLKEMERGIKISDEDLQKAYQEHLKANQNEYKARHILTQTQKEAEAVIEELDGGADFATLAKEKSTGPSGKQGGDLGWFKAQDMVPAFSVALTQMSKGTYSKTPVQTQFGWHVILVEDVRELPKPEFASMREQLKASLLNNRLQQELAQLRASAKVEKLKP